MEKAEEGGFIWPKDKQEKWEMEQQVENSKDWEHTNNLEMQKLNIAQWNIAPDYVKPAVLSLALQIPRYI